MMVAILGNYSFAIRSVGWIRCRQSTNY